MVCPKCRATIALGSQFCAQCGYRLASSSIPIQETAGLTRGASKVQSAKRAGLGCLGCFSLIILLAIIGLLLPKPPKTKGTAPTPVPAAVTRPIIVIPYRFVSTYDGARTSVTSVLVKNSPSKSEMVSLSRALHARYPTRQFRFYNDSSQIANCLWNDIHQDEPERGCPFPWLQHHYFGMVNNMWVPPRTDTYKWEYVPSLAVRNGDLTGSWASVVPLE